ncbi:MAG: hypothetical protein SFV19_00665 [Rhodospirillaceae bacterium]|nr:hypothetical protein [Rhodospirillaceae bacterium]
MAQLGLFATLIGRLDLQTEDGEWAFRNRKNVRLIERMLSSVIGVLMPVAGVSWEEIGGDWFLHPDHLASPETRAHDALELARKALSET